jgi:hypothetical protein
MRKFLTVVALLIMTSAVAQAQTGAPAWHSWADVIPFPTNIDLSAVDSVYYEVYDINALDPVKCPTHCFRVKVFVNDSLIAVIPTSPGSGAFNWGGRTPEFRNTSLARTSSKSGPRRGYKGYRLHTVEYHSSRRDRGNGLITGNDNLRYFTVFKTNSGRDVGIGFHGDKGGVYKVTGEPESHGCMRLTDNNAYIVNMLARAVVDNTGSADNVRISAYHTRRF